MKVCGLHFPISEYQIYPKLSISHLSFAQCYRLFGKKNEEEDTAIVTKPKQAEINIFSVASGKLYERFLSIMITSVMRHTESTVKFWFIENFLSPEFKVVTLDPINV